MKKILLLFILQCSVFCFSQTLKPIAHKISEYHKDRIPVRSYDLFELNTTSNKLSEYRKAATDLTAISLKSTELKRLISEKPEFIEISFPFEGGQSVTVELYRNQILTNDFKVVTGKGNTVNYTPGIYYQGIVKGDNSSVAAFSFFKDDVVGVASTPELGNIVLGKVKNSEDFVSYSDSKLTGVNPFICGADELKKNNDKKISFTPDLGKVITPTENCVRVYYEATFRVYQNNSSNTTTVTNWLTAIHNNIATLYTNDNIRTALSEIYIWTTQDPYTDTPETNLTNFEMNRRVFNGDLAHLINQPSTKSVANLNSLCTAQNYAYSGVNQTYSNVPVYSWTINAMSHEMGHALGSPHTHNCAWNGNNTPIDWCGPEAMPSIIDSEGITCTSNVLPASGTIMSYCHLISGIGVNFSNGFGDQPAALIRNTVDIKGCLGTNCITSCGIPITGINFTNTTQNSTHITFSDTTSSTWKYKLTRIDGTVVTTGNTSQQNFSLTGLLPATYYKLYIGSDCPLANAYETVSLFLTDGTWCAGTQFTDTGELTANYGDNEEFVKTFYPASASALTMIFTQFALEKDYDFMYIYNGPSTAAPLFANGDSLSGNIIPGPFTSTHPSGAITVKFKSDSAVNLSGWVANFNCNVLSVDDINEKEGSINIYPNPAKNIMIISSDEALKAYKIYDESGRLIMSSSSLKGHIQEINLSSIQTGNYIITIETAKQTIMKKLIKQ